MRSESLAGDGKIDEAIAVLRDAAATAPEDAGLVAARISMLARAAKGDDVSKMVAGLSEALQDSADVLAAETEAARILPAAAGDELVELVFQQRPEDLRSAMAALHSRMRRADREAVAKAAESIVAIAGEDSTEAGYAQATVWLLDAVTAAGDLTDDARRELVGFRKRLSAIELARPEWTELQTLLAEIELLEGHTNEAIARLQGALETRPSDREIPGRLAVLLTSAGRYAEAEKVLGSLDTADVQRLGRIAADLRLRAGKVAEAMSIAEEAAKSGTDDPADLLWLAETLSRHGRTAQAVVALERGASLAPERVDMWLALADQHAAAGDASGAAALLERRLERMPEARRPLVRAEIERHAGRLDAAVAAYRALLTRPGVDTVEMRRAVECFRVAGLNNDVRKALEALVTMRPGSVPDQEAIRWARRQAVEVGLRDGTFTAAKEAIQSLAENSGGTGSLTPEDADFAAGLLAQRPEPRSWRMALEILDNLGQRQSLAVPQSVLAARLRGRVGDWRRAREDLKTMALQPDMPADVYAALVDSLVTHDDTKTAARWMGELLSRASEAPETIVLEARLALARGDKPAAVAAAKRLMPKDEVTAGNLAVVLTTAATMEELGFVAAADNLLVRASDVGGEGVPARVAFLLRQNRLDEAAALLEAAKASMPSMPGMEILEAVLAEKRGQQRDAESIYQRVADSADASDAERLQAKARLARCLVDRDAASEAFSLADRAVVDLGPHPELLDARGVASIATGNTAGAIRDLGEAVLAPTQERLLHLAHAKILAEDSAEAREIMARAARLGLERTALRPSDRHRLDLVVKQLGAGLR